jgi:YD repeat-containing protein
LRDWRFLFIRWPLVTHRFGCALFFRREGTHAQVQSGIDAFNRVTSVTLPDPDGGGGVTASVTSYTLDRLDRVTRITDALSGQTNFTYDAAGNLTGLQDALGNDTTWTFDGLGRVTQETNELSSSRYFVYDAASNLLRKTDRNNQVTRYQYDNLDRLTSELWISGGTANPTVTGATSTQGGPTSEVQRVGYAITGGGILSGGTFTLTFDGQTTSAINYNASAATVLAALEALSNIDPGEV